MATGRGQFFESLRQGLEKTQLANVAAFVKHHKTMSATPSKRRRRKCKSSEPAGSKSLGGCRALSTTEQRAKNYIERLPPEIILRILSYLDAASLFCIGYVNKQFNELANSNDMWYKLYSREYAKNKWRPKRIEKVTDGMRAVTVQERPKGYWRRLFFREMAGYNENKWKKELKAINPYTGLPRQTEQVLRSLGVTWEITLTDKKGRESTFEQSHVYFSDSSVTLCWSSGDWPFIDRISTLQLHGVMRVRLDCPTANKPGWRSLISKVEFGKDTWKAYGSDKIVKLRHIDPGIAIGVWRGQWKIAFIMVNLHFHKLVERSVLGSSVCSYGLDEDRPPFDDVDPEYGLHGYSAHIVFHNTVKHIMSGHFSQLFCRRDQIRGGFIELRAICMRNMSQHTPLSGKINLPWRTEALQGTIENCCMMSLTVLDEVQNPFWCVSSPVQMVLSDSEMSYDYDGPSYFISFQESRGKVRLKLVWLEEQNQFFLIKLSIFLPVARVNRHFGRDYRDWIEFSDLS
ncbi:F-box only protein 15 [Chanos chanos]|uniref:F-box only protein 15 n=1 Tax=Chanos chanos TaxID=29144 RepID=A0A6J2UWG2_CHACN|nr:F-box only protein 15 [Chanos chanos]